MSWSELQFGKHIGLTLPQVLFTDPGWFFWALRLPLRGEVGYEASILAPKATRIRVPQAEGCRLIVEYILDPRGGGLAGVQIIPEAEGGDGGGSTSFTRPWIDLSVPSQLAHYDKTGGKIIISFLKETYFGSTRHRMTRELCSGFFHDPSNFLP